MTTFKQLKPMWFVIIALTCVNILVEIYLAYTYRNSFYNYNFIISLVLLCGVLVSTIFSYLSTIKPENIDKHASATDLGQLSVFLIVTIFYLVRNYFDYITLKKKVYILL